jgi:hypothetical protein
LLQLTRNTEREEHGVQRQPQADHFKTIGNPTMRRLPSAISSAILGFVIMTAVQPARAQFEPLAAKVPTSANAIVLLDGQRLLASPLAVREGWKEKYEQAFASGLVAIAPDTQRLVLASQIDYEFMRPQWEVAVADVGKARSAAEIATHERTLVRSAYAGGRLR